MRAARAALALVAVMSLSVEADAATRPVDRAVADYWFAVTPVCGYDLDRSGRAAREAANQRFARLRARFHASDRRREIETAITTARRARDNQAALVRCVMPDGVVTEADRAYAGRAQVQATNALNRLETMLTRRRSKGSN